MARGVKKEPERSERVCPFCLLTDTLEAAVKDFRSSPVGKHLCNAEREVLLAVRAAIDRCIESVEPGRAKAEPRIQKVKVE